MSRAAITKPSCLDHIRMGEQAGHTNAGARFHTAKPAPVSLQPWLGARQIRNVDVQERSSAIRLALGTKGDVQRSQADDEGRWCRAP